MLEDTEVWGYAMAKEQRCSGGVECWTGLKECVERHTVLVAFGKGVAVREAGWCRMTTFSSRFGVRSGCSAQKSWLLWAKQETSVVEQLASLVEMLVAPAHCRMGEQARQVW